MVRINLLPWREELRELNKREFLVMLAGSAIFAILIIVIIHMIIAGRLSSQNARINFLEQQISQANTQIKALADIEKQKEQLTTSLKTTIQLHNDRFEVVRALDGIVRMLPEGIHLTRIERINDVWNLMGYANSNIEVTQLMKLLEKSSIFTDPDLIEISTEKDKAAVTDIDKFKLQVKIKR